MSIVEQDVSFGLGPGTQDFIETVIATHVETWAEIERERLAIQRSWLGFAATLVLIAGLVLIVRAF